MDAPGNGRRPEYTSLFIGDCVFAAPVELTLMQLDELLIAGSEFRERVDLTATDIKPRSTDS